MTHTAYPLYPVSPASVVLVADGISISAQWRWNGRGARGSVFVIWYPWSTPELGGCWVIEGEDAMGFVTRRSDAPTPTFVRVALSPEAREHPGAAAPFQYAAVWPTEQDLVRLMTMILTNPVSPAIITDDERARFDRARRTALAAMVLLSTPLT